MTTIIQNATYVDLHLKSESLRFFILNSTSAPIRMKVFQPQIQFCLCTAHVPRLAFIIASGTITISEV